MNKINNISVRINDGEVNGYFIKNVDTDDIIIMNVDVENVSIPEVAYNRIHEIMIQLREQFGCSVIALPSNVTVECCNKEQTKKKLQQIIENI